MSRVGVSDSIEDRAEQKRQIAFLLLVVSVAALLRILLAYHGGIWGDEGFFLLVVGAPSWTTMIDFLRFHESHPPLFYALMRIWMWAVGNRDATALILPVLIGVAIVPAIYLVGARLFSGRAGMVAAGLAALSPPLSEYSAQLRPYGLLPLLVLISCYTLIISLAEGGWRRWSGYVVTTILLLYTHNWSWLVVLGQLVSVVSLLPNKSLVDRNKVVRQWTLSWVAIGLAYLPWFTTFLYQAGHAGHGPVFVEGLGLSLGLALVAAAGAVVTVIFGALSDRSSTMSVAAAGIAIVAGAMMRWRWPVFPRTANETRGEVAGNPSQRHAIIALRIMLVVPVAAILTAILASPRTNLFLPRCLAMLTPLALLVFARWLDRQWAFPGGSRSAQAQAAAALLACVVTVSAFGLEYLIRTPRSNVREVAKMLAANTRPTDLVILAPEWYAAGFNHYFAAPVEQIDYPHAGRSGMVDFSDVMKRVADPRPLARLRKQIVDASRAGRRVWVVSGRNYVREISPRDVIDATQHGQWGVFSSIRVHQIRSALNASYGEPDTSYFSKGLKPRYEEIVSYLYSRGAEVPAGTVPGR